jgi:putative membrane protein
MLSQSDHTRIAAAVSRAEASTSGEILCVLAHKVSDYRETTLAWAIGAALIAPPVAMIFGLRPWLMSQQGGDWVATNATSLDVSVELALTGYIVLQVVIFAAVAVAMTVSQPLRLALTPRRLKQRQVRRAALQQLTATHLLGVSAAVVIFASETERMVAVAADESIHLKAGDAAWEAAVAAVLKGVRSGKAAAGFIEAVEICGGYLAEHFPADAGTHHVLSDGLMEI